MRVWGCEEVYLWNPPAVAYPLEDSWKKMKVRELLESGGKVRVKILFRRDVDREDLDLEAVRQKEHF